MEVTTAFFADLAKADASGKINAIGVFNQLILPEFPYKLEEELAFVLMLDVADVDATAKHSVKMTIAKKGGEDELFFEGPMMDLASSEGESPITVSQMVARIGGFLASEPGQFVFKIFIDGEYKHQTSLRLLKATGRAA